MSACIIPVAPEFEDPVVKNYAPVLDSVNPPFWSVADEQTTFTVRISDPNLSDTLYARLLADYPPRSSLTRDLPGLPAQFPPVTPPSTNTSRGEVSFSVDCTTFIATQEPQHRIVLLLADRPFTTVSGQLQPAKGGLMAEGGWLLNLNCP